MEDVIIMRQFGFPTTIFYGQGSLDEFMARIKNFDHNRTLIVTDSVIRNTGLLGRLLNKLENENVEFSVFDGVRPNPDESDVEAGLQAFKDEKCDSLIALGGGSSIDTAKIIKLLAVHSPPLSQYVDAEGGEKLITKPMPSLYAIPTTAGTGSEVGRSGVIILKETGKKSIFFHPDLIPRIAVLEPEMTTGLPPEITAATGIDAFSHCLEAYFAAGFHPMADGIAIEGMKLILDWLPIAWHSGDSIEAREKMLIASSMGATAFQKGLGMIHSLAHPLSGLFGMHHGLANALMIQPSIEFLENCNLNRDQVGKLTVVRRLLEERDYAGKSLSECLGLFIESFEIQPGLSTYGISGDDIYKLANHAYSDPSHLTNMVPVVESQFKEIYMTAL